jgi:hypothetical protein
MQSKRWCGGLALVLMAVCAPAAATLGEDAATVPADQARMQATLQAANAAGFAVQRLLLPSGTTVREYVSSSGMVFAVSWQGPEVPDLQQLLGRYFEAYVEAVKNRSAGGARSARQRGLVVQTGGHMRAYYGRVYVAAMLPRGVAEEEIQ